MNNISSHMYNPKNRYNERAMIRDGKRGANRHGEATVIHPHGVTFVDESNLCDSDPGHIKITSDGQVIEYGEDNR